MIEAAELVKTRGDDLITQATRVETMYKRAMRSQPAAARQSEPGLFINKRKLAKVLDEVGPFTEDTLFIGIADDGLPILLDLEDTDTGSMLFIGDRKAGKNPQLKTIAAALEFTHTPEQIKFAVITDDPNRWRDLQDSPNLINIFSYYSPGTPSFLEGLVNWTSVNRNSSQVIVLLIDNVNHMIHMPPDARENLSWLLRYGAEHKVRIFATLETHAYLMKTRTWRAMFGTLLYGKTMQDMPAVSARHRRRGEFILTGNEGTVVRFHTPLLTM